MFWRVTVPLVRPATITVVTLSLIGGLRSFDLIWAMTRGGPGFSSDVLASVIYKQYQAGFYGLVDRRQRHPVPADRRHHPAAHRLVQPPGGRPVTRRQYVIGFVCAGRHLRRLRRAVHLRLPDRGEEQGARPRASTSPGRPSGTSCENLVEVVQTRDYMLLLAYFNSTVITVGAVALLVIFGAMIGYVLQRRPSRLEQADLRLRPRRADDPAGGGADDLGAAGAAASSRRSTA